MVAPVAAMKAYAAAQKALESGSASSSEASSGPSFSSLLQNVMSGVVQSSTQAEHQMTAHAAGKADLVDVVTSVASAETSLDTVMAVRDQVISAYQEVMRMPL
jgi:flagellar hook-basal body complex protein FliE